MLSRRLRLASAGAVVALGVFLAASVTSNAGKPSIKRGGTLVGIAVGDFDSIDPGITYSTSGFELMTALHRTLYTAALDGRSIHPDLAAAPPIISTDARSVTVTLRGGIRFGPPVSREVRSEDVKYAIERGFTAAVPNGYVSSYYTVLQGAGAFQAGKAPGIAGIATPDPRTIVFRLTEPVGGFFAGALSMPLTAPVPREYAQPFDTVKKGAQSTYGPNQVSTGPYMIERNATGVAVGYKNGQYLHLVRNPNWDPASDVRPAYADRIELQTGFSTSPPATRRVLSGHNTFGFAVFPPNTVLQRLLRQKSSQLTLASVPGFNYLGLNTTIAPLGNVNVRRAIAAALDRRELQRLAGGSATGQIATHFLPPSSAGFQEAGGARASVRFLAKPQGDLPLAHAYMRKAGYASGRYRGSARLALVTTRDPDTLRADRVIKRAFDALGLPLRLRILAPDAASKACSTPKAHAALCQSGWLADFPDPQTMLQSVFDGRAIIAHFNPNLAQIDDARVNAAIDRAKPVVGARARAQAWARVDRLVTSLVPDIPTTWPITPLIAGKGMSGEINHLAGTWELASTGQTGG